MSFGLKILIGFSIGIFFGLIMMVKTIKKNIKFLDNTAVELIQLLIERYKKLLKFLNLVKNYMQDEKEEIESLISLLEDFLSKEYRGLDLSKVISSENLINKKLEAIKQRMNNYPNIYENYEIKDAINEIIDAEAQIGAGINIYNKLHTQVKAFLEMFPISLAASLSGQKMEHVPFFVNTVQEFDDNYIDEDEI